MKIIPEIDVNSAPDCMSLDDAAALLFASPRQIKRLIDNGELSCKTTASGGTLIPVKAVHAYRALRLTLADRYFAAQQADNQPQRPF